MIKTRNRFFRISALIVCATATLFLSVQVNAFELSTYAGPPLEPHNPMGSTPRGDFNVLLTQNASKEIDELADVACAAGNGDTTDNAWSRTFDLSTLPFGTSQDFQISSADVGISTATDPSGAAIPGTISFYSDDDDDPTTGTVLLGSIDAPVPDGTSLSILNFAGGPNVPAGTDWLFVEYFSASGPSDDNRILRVGANGLGQTGPSYVEAADCGLTAPTDLASIGFPDSHVILNVQGTQVPEPSAVMLVFFGFAGLLGLRRRR